MQCIECTEQSREPLEWKCATFKAHGQTGGSGKRGRVVDIVIFVVVEKTQS